VGDAEPFFFVSHVSENRDSAMEIVSELERRGTRCWIAPRDILPGRPFDDEIADAIESSRAMLLIFSDLCNDSEYIRREVTYAGESHKTVIPFRIEDVQPRRGLRVRLSDLHWIDGFVSRERAVEELLKTFPLSANAGQATGAPALAARGESNNARNVPSAEARSHGRDPASAAARDTSIRDATSHPNIGPNVASIAGPAAGSLAAKANRNPWLILIGGAAVLGLVGSGAFVVMRHQEAPAPSSAAQPAAPAKMEIPASVTPEVKQAATLRESGDADLIKKDYDRAIADYTEAIRLDPTLAVTFSGRGSAYYEKHDYDRAVADQTEAIRIDPKLADAYLHRGWAYSYGKKDYDRAIADYTKAIQLDPSFLGAYFHRGWAYWDGKRDYDHAIADYQTVLRLNPAFDLAYNNSGLIFQYGKKDLDRAVAEFTLAIQANPKYALYYFNRGRAYKEKMNIDLAIADDTEAIRLNPGYREAYVERGNANADKKNFDLSIADYAEAIRIDPNSADAYLNRGSVYYNAKQDYDRAIADFSEAIRIDPKFALAFSNRALAYLQKKDFDHAIADYTELIRLDPKNAWAIYQRGLAKQKTGNAADGDADIASAKALDPNLGK
jgi:tetratricopeptide (TPR) repeat protein